MPLYEYQCENCGDVFELIQKFSDEPLTVHEKCGGKVHRLISTSALMFKGSGWYVNDYAKKSGGGATASSKKDGESSSSSKEGSSPSSDSSSSSSSSTESKESKAATPAPATSTTSSDK